jgi:hypothetical protein
MNQAKVDRFVADAGKLHALIKGLAPEDLVSHPIPGTWSLQTLVLHVLDSDLIATHRMKRIIAEERPLLISYDETAFAASLYYERLDAPLAAELFRVNRLQMGQILRCLPEETFTRWGVHNQRGKVTLGQLVEDYTQHVEHHFAYAREKLKALGRPVTI